MHRPLHPSFFALTVALSLAVSCKELERVDQDTDGGSAGIPDDVQLAFDASCNQVGCHDAATASEGLSLVVGASESIIGAPASQSGLPLVDIGNVCGSYMAIKLLPDERVVDCGEARMKARMPQGSFDDPEHQKNVALILGWIAGAELPDGDAPMLQSCGFADLAVAGATSPVVHGEMAMTLPSEIGTIIENNCGCHLASEAEFVGPAVRLYSGAFALSTWEELHSDYPGLAKNYDRMLQFVQADRMPPPDFCHPLAPADRQVLEDWLVADAPDALNWPP